MNRRDLMLGSLGAAALPALDELCVNDGVFLGEVVYTGEITGSQTIHLDCRGENVFSRKQVEDLCKVIDEAMRR